MNVEEVGRPALAEEKGKTVVRGNAQKGSSKSDHLREEMDI